jgi:hypothetical protein
MGNLIQRNRGKRGAPDVTRNLSTGKVTTTYRDPRKKGSLGLRVTKSHDSNGNVHVTESFNYGGGVTKKTRTKQNKGFSFFGSRTTSGRTRRSSGSNIQLPADVQLALMIIGGGLAIIGFVLYYLAIYWYLSIPAALLLWYGYKD